ADPRRAENKEIINAMVKKREAFRPFAPSILEEYAAEYFELPHGRTKFPFMTFVVKTRKEKQDLLRATTHIDETAGIQTVAKTGNRRFWDLIDEFRKVTQVPVLLNTSFNNNVEPIVDSVEDAIVCFLTTDLHYLVVGDYLISKKPLDEGMYLPLAPSLPAYSSLVQTRKTTGLNGTRASSEVCNTCASWGSVPVSEVTFRLLSNADGRQSLRGLLTGLGLADGELHEAV